MRFEDERLKLIYLAREAKSLGLSQGDFGSFSCLMHDKKNILITPSNVHCFDLRPDDIIITGRNGETIENCKDNDVPDNIGIHLVSYDMREGTVNVVMYINPPNATERANEGNRIIFLSDCIDPEESENGNISELIKNPICHRDYMLIKNNGVLVVGEGIFETLDKARYIEEIAKVKMPQLNCTYQPMESGVNSIE